MGGKRVGGYMGIPQIRMRCLTAVVLLLGAASGFCGDTDFNYGDAGADVSDIRFYIPATDAAPYALPPAMPPPVLKNVILLIGDGMGFAQVSMARAKAVGINGRLYMEKLPVQGEITTHSESGLTDSAAAGTALACGVKTHNKTIGMNAVGKACQSILEAAKEKGNKTALVVTSTISHATPASFASHVSGRAMEAEIAAQILENKVNVLLGGGRSFWIPKSHKGSKRDDDRNLLEEAASAGYLLVKDAEALTKATGDYVLGLFQMNALTTLPPEPALPQMVHAALRLLAGDGKEGGSGFFMMVEGSQIDWAGHANNSANSIKQVLLFDQAVKMAVDHAMKDGHTLVIVTADHETGGLTSHEGDFKWTARGHTDARVPVYAFGPGSDQFSGFMDNTDIPKKIAALMGIKDFPKIIE